MSLKAFHVLFIMLATMMSAGCALWAFHQYTQSRDGGLLVFAVASAAACVAFLIYGVWFVRKKKHLSYI